MPWPIVNMPGRRVNTERRTTHIRGDMGDRLRNLHRDDDEERLARADAIVEERQAQIHQAQGLTSAGLPAASGKAPNGNTSSSSTTSAAGATGILSMPRKHAPTQR